jgi:hypothetical protein
MRTQKPNKTKRKRVSSYLNNKLKAIVEAEARRYDCSKSFVVANALAFAFNIPVKETYNARRNQR